MVAKYLYNSNGISFYTDKSLISDDDTTNRLIGVMDAITGVEKVEVSKYTLDIMYGVLFEPEDVMPNIILTFKAFFGLSACDLFDLAVLNKRRMRLLEDLDPELASVVRNATSTMDLKKYIDEELN
jgi:hypothetical protein